jgi:hypothetical protein
MERYPVADQAMADTGQWPDPIVATKAAAVADHHPGPDDRPGTNFDPGANHGVWPDIHILADNGCLIDNGAGGVLPCPLGAWIEQLRGERESATGFSGDQRMDVRGYPAQVFIRDDARAACQQADACLGQGPARLVIAQMIRPRSVKRGHIMNNH